ncbi:SLC13 family permease [Acidiphilium sp. PA]|uniref:SLC13 family permease n=1 Tax=Acidiphilium sp. PA TaxID=2871705 RepID=UPI0022438B22|nr:SLC13 family permease [Acidiphilium sp. PA]MCW8307187.1 SLC13 family permease [Acidiphilium sp. PA]
MPPAQMIVFAVIGATLVLFLTNIIRYDLVAVAALMVLAITHVLKPDAVFAGFANPAVITVASVLIMGHAMWQSGVVDLLAKWLGRAAKTPSGQLVALTGSEAVSSALINDTGSIGVFMPVAIQLARRSGTSVSRFLMPLGFSAFLGGMTTLIGTSPNIIIAAYRGQLGHGGFTMFSFTPVGAGVAVAGLVFMAAFSRFLVPERQSAKGQDEHYGMAKYLTEAEIPQGSPFDGRTIGELEEGIDASFAIIGLVHGADRRVAPRRYHRMQGGDHLVIEADADNLTIVLDTAKLTLASDKDIGDDFLKSNDIDIIECVIQPESRLIGKSAASLGLRKWYGVNLLAVARQGERIKGRHSAIPLQASDILLLQGDAETLDEVMTQLGCLPLAERAIRVGKPARIATALGIFAVAITLAATRALPSDVAFASGALAMVLARLIPTRALYDAVEWPVIVLLGAIIPVGQALQQTGGAKTIAALFIDLAHHLPSFGVVALMLLVTMILSNVINHAATAVLMAPVAVGVAHGLHVGIDPLLMAVAVGAALPMVVPTGHQCNILVMGPGGYRAGDYWRLGLPLSVVCLVVAVPLIMLVWPLHPG